MSKIVRLESTNYKRLKAVEIAPDPDGNLVIVAGKNGQGKTSILDSITRRSAA
jgi:recombinational DNA repair ATPase RecF